MAEARHNRSSSSRASSRAGKHAGSAQTRRTRNTAPTRSSRNGAGKGTSASKRSTTRTTNAARATRRTQPQRTTRSQNSTRARSANVGAIRAQQPRSAHRGKGKSRNIVAVILGGLATGLFSFFSLIGKGILHAFGSLRARHPRTAVLAAVLVVFALFNCVCYAGDYVTRWGKVMPNVTVGGIDVAGMTRDEAIDAVKTVYEPRLTSSDVEIYSTEEGMALHHTNAASSDEVTVEEELASTEVWNTNAANLNASINYDALIDAAMAEGRGGIFDRIGLFFGARELSVVVSFGEDDLEWLASQIDSSMGEAYENYGITISKGQASVTEGHDGMMVDRSWFADKLSALLTSDDSVTRAFVAEVVYTPMKINEAAAQATCNTINDAIAYGLTFSEEGSEWHATSSDLGDMITTDIVQNDDGTYTLAPTVDSSKVKHYLVTQSLSGVDANNLTVAFEKESDGIYVNVTSGGLMPETEDAVAQITNALFGGEAPSSAPTITLKLVDMPSHISVDEAISLGLITKISSYTTEYTARSEARNHNIHLAADLLDNSIVSSNGGVWSFNDTAGECNQEAGFQVAGVVVNGVSEEDFGGGICQVATTIFNAVYNAGYPVKERHNHSSYIASYPAGRDAAISYPSPDLKWTNDGTSDVLLDMSYTDTTITATLYGIDPGYVVSTETGEWQEGAEYGTTYTYDDTIAAGTQYVQTEGKNGSSISVTRTVKDSEGNVLHKDLFQSTYVAVNEVVVVGTKS